MRLHQLSALVLCAVLSVPLAAAQESAPGAPDRQQKAGPGKAKAASEAGRAKAAGVVPATALADFDAYMARVMKEWKVPGVAVAIVKDGAIVLNKGYGFRDVKNQLPVTPKTMFPIASITKSFTVAALATLSTEGRLDWDKPVRDYLPEFRLADDVLTARVTPRDLVTHRTGLPRHDASWYNVDTPTPDLVAALRHLEPNKDLRQQFQYNNLMFITAGYMAGRLSGGTWEQAVRTRVFQPLGMASSNFSIDDSKKSSDYAHAYQKDDNEEVHEIPMLKADNVGAAGGINSSLEDMTQYLLMYLNKGKRADRRIISEADVRQMTSPQMVIPGADVDPELGYTNYGMGLFVTTYRGHKLVHHGGNLDGFSLLLSWLPDDNVGSVILTNMDATATRDFIAYNIYDRMLGLDQVDWSSRAMKRYLAGKNSEKEATAKNYVPRREGTRPSHPTDEYVGEYTHPAYGTITIGRAGEGTDLKVGYHGFTSTAKHWHYDQWKIPQDALDRLERTDLMFNTDWQGNLSSLSVPMEPQVKDIVFLRMPERRMRERAFLEPLAGVYTLSDFKYTVAMRGETTLSFTSPSGAAYELEPVRGTMFTVKSLPGRTLEFKLDASGKVIEAAFSQPGSTVVLKRVQ